MPNGTAVKHYEPGASLNAKVRKIMKLFYPCFLYDIFLSGPDADARMAPYRDLLDNTPNLQQVVTTLKGISMNNGGTGYDAILRTLINYHPDLSWKSQERLFSCRMKTDYLFNKTFLVRTVHILWMEQNGQLPWSIKNYSKDEIRGLFFEFFVSLTGPMRPTLPPQSQFANEWEDIPEELIPLEASYKLHAIAMKLKGGTREQSAITCIRFLKSNFFHSYTSGSESWMLDRYVGGKPFPGVAGTFCCCPPSLSRLFEERIAGCHSPTVLLCELMRLLNIPALPVNFAGHGVTFIPGLDRFVHGDHLVICPLYPSLILMLTSSEMAEYKFDSMMFPTIARKLTTVVDPAYANVVKNHPICRNGTTLTIPFSDLQEIMPANVLALMQQEAPQFNIQNKVTGDGLTSQPVPIRTLEDFSATGSDLWH